jgi:hypothetical protein
VTAWPDQRSLTRLTDNNETKKKPNKIMSCHGFIVHPHSSLPPPPPPPPPPAMAAAVAAAIGVHPHPHPHHPQHHIILSPPAPRPPLPVAAVAAPLRLDQRTDCKSGFGIVAGGDSRPVVAPPHLQVGSAEILRQQHQQQQQLHRPQQQQNAGGGSKADIPSGRTILGKGEEAPG